MPTALRRSLMLLMLVALVAGWQADPRNTPGNTPADQSGGGPPTGSPGGGAVVPSTAGPSGIPSGARMAVVRIEGGIFYEYQLDSLKARVERALANGADAIVIELDTPGGAMYLSIEFCHYIKQLQVPTIAWVNTRALSAGSLIASACDEMVMGRSAIVGDCAPVSPGGALAPTERAKALSPLLAEFRDNAEENYAGPSGSDYAAFHAMCVLDIPVYRVRHKQTGEVRLVNAVDLAVMVNGLSTMDALDSVPDSVDPADAIQNAPPAGASPQAGGAYAGLEDLDYGQVAGPSLVIGNDQHRGDWELLEQVHDGNTLLTVSAKEAARMGLSRATVSSMDELKQHYQAAEVGLVKETWSESAAWFLLNPWVRGVLVVLLLVGGFLEYVSPGLILPGTVAGIAMLLLIAPPFVVGLASIWHIIVIVLGLAILLFELFTLTTGGLLVIVGLAMILIGLALAAVQTTSSGLPAPGTADQLVVSALSMGGGLIIAVPAFILITRYFGELPGLKRLVLDAPASGHAVNSRGEPVEAMPPNLAGAETVGAGWIKPGMTGRVTSTGLRPAGRIEVEDRLIDVTSTGGFIESGTLVAVTEVHGNIVMVEPAEDPS